MIKYFVRTTGERTLDESFSQIEYELLIDTEHKCGTAFLKQLEIINDYDAVLMEDDIILCKDFKNRIEEVISKYPNDIINFFTVPTIYFQTYKTQNFSYNQCTYFPKGIAKKLLSVYNPRFHKESAEFLLNNMLCVTKIKHIKYRPCLVQHIDEGSLMNHNYGWYRRSPFFIDYLDELGVTYEDAKKLEIKAKLTTLMRSKFKKIENLNTSNSKG